MRKTGKTRGDWEHLIAAAREVSGHAHAPYSRLLIGAALEAEGGAVYTGCNIENSSFGLTICAERVALHCALAHGARKFKRLVIYTADAGPLPPCGACRQVLMEFVPRLPILSIGRGGLRREFELADLLPEAFGWPAGEASSRPEG
jgi:cytidine deaminase